MTRSPLAFRPRHALFRTTFVRGHVDPQLTTIDDVLAVKFLAGDLERGLGRRPTADERRLLLDDFFGREESDRWLYLPLALLPHAGDRPILPPDHSTCLTDYLARPPRGAPGVLLSARSGAGKTMAGIKAFRDCVVRARGADQPPLADRLPVRLRLSGLSAAAETLSDIRRQADTDPAAARRRAGQVDSPRIVEELLLVAADLTASLESLRQWLRAGPLLLLFLDLNTADNDAVRLAVARSLSRFQEDYARFGHRCIVTYRSTEAHDDAMTALREREGALFRTFDLAPVDPTNAVAYLRHLRVFEADVYAHFDLTPPQRDIERECRTLEEFVQRYAVNRESLISTPLIMELVATLRPRKPGDVKSIEFIKSLADLYERVVEDLLDRQGLTSEDDQRNALTAMVRLALAIVARGPKAVQLDGRQNFIDLLEFPEYGDRGQYPWHPAGEFWLGHPKKRCPYYSGEIQPAERYRERALFAARGESVGFLHDSFAYYFAAYALRFHNGRDRPPSDVGVDPEVWSHEAATRILPQLASWEQPLEFLGGMLSAEEVRQLVVPLLTAEPRPEMARVMGRLLRGRRWREQGGDDAVLRQLERAVRSRLSEVERHLEALFAHVYNHLAWCEEPQKTSDAFAFADRTLRPAMNATGRPWLCAMTPMPPQREQVFRCDSSVRSLAIYAPGEFITGHDDGMVRRWWVDRGQSQILYQHEGRVYSVAVNSKTWAVVSGGEDGTVRRWLPGEDDAIVLYQHSGMVRSVAVDSRIGAVVSGGDNGPNGTIGWWLPGQDDPKMSYQHEDHVYSVALDSRDGMEPSVVWGGSDGTVCRWYPGEDDAKVLYQHGGEVQSVAVDSQDGAVLSGGYNKAKSGGAILRWLSGQGDAAVVSQHKDLVWAMAVDSRNGAVIWGGLEGMVRRCLPGQDHASVLYRHEDMVRSVAVDSRDGTVFSGGDDGTIRRWLPDQDSAAVVYEQKHSVWSVTVDSRNGDVVSGGSDRKVRRWLAGLDAVDELYQHHEFPKFLHKEEFDRVNSVAVDSRDGAVVSGGGDGTVRRWLPGQKDAKVLCRHLGAVQSVSVDSRNGAVVWGGLGRVWRWLPGQDDAAVVYEHDRDELHPLFLFLLGIVVMVDSRDETVLSRGNEAKTGGAILRWLSGQNDAAKLYRHEDLVWFLDKVGAVSVDSRNGAVVWGGREGAVRCLLPGQDDAVMLYRHEGWIQSVAVDEFANSLLSGGRDANLHLFGLATHDFLFLLTPSSIRSVACSLRHNRIAIALGDGRLVLVRVEPSVETLLHWRANPSEGRTPSSESARQ